MTFFVRLKEFGYSVGVKISALSADIIPKCEYIRTSIADITRYMKFDLAEHK